eukprot:sb/3475646/
MHEANMTKVKETDFNSLGNVNSFVYNYTSQYFALLKQSSTYQISTVLFPIKLLHRGDNPALNCWILTNIQMKTVHVFWLRQTCQIQFVITPDPIPSFHYFQKIRKEPGTHDNGQPYRRKSITIR